MRGEEQSPQQQSRTTPLKYLRRSLRLHHHLLTTTQRQPLFYRCSSTRSTDLPNVCNSAKCLPPCHYPVLFQRGRTSFGHSVSIPHQDGLVCRCHGRVGDSNLHLCLARHEGETARWSFIMMESCHLRGRIRSVLLGVPADITTTTTTRHAAAMCGVAVSYTHLTLPTTPYV